MPPGPSILPAYYTINAFKFLTLPLCLYLTLSHPNPHPAYFIYTALHGSYGFIWLLKHACIPDSSWNKKQTFLSMMITASGLMGYWMMPITMMRQEVTISNERIALCVFTYALGVVVMMVSDAQKYFTLKFKKGA